MAASTFARVSGETFAEPVTTRLTVGVETPAAAATWLMVALRDALPPNCLGGYADQSDELEPILLDAIAPGDVIMVKGSNASRMGPLVEALTTRFVQEQAAANDPHGQEPT